MLLCVQQDVNSTDRVATNLENLEYSRFFGTWKTPGILWILCNLRENCNKQSIFSSSFKYLRKTAVDWVNGIIMTPDEDHYYVYSLLYNGNLGKSKPEKLW